MLIGLTRFFTARFAELIRLEGEWGWNSDVVFCIRFKYGRGADEGAMPIGNVCLPGETTRTPSRVYT
jgi:hypothetical protein